VRQTAEAPHQKLTAERCHQMFKHHLTLIFKVDNLLHMYCRSRPCGLAQRAGGHRGKIMSHFDFFAAPGKAAPVGTL
jgi:hypothetical protein